MSNSNCLDVLALKRLKELARLEGGRDAVPFEDFHKSLSSSADVSQVEAWGVLKSMEESGLIEIDPFDGIRVIV